MTKEEALKIIEGAPYSDIKKSKMNPSLTQKQVVDILRNGLLSFKDGEVLTDLYVKRVFQVKLNQKRPKIYKISGGL